MSVLNEVQERLYGRFTEAHGATPYCFGNEAFDPPGDGPWVRFSVKSSASSQRTLGAPGQRRFERRGVAYAQVFIAPGQGVGVPDALADNIRKTFEGCRFEPHDILFGACHVNEGVQVDNGRWYMVTAEMPFDYEERR